MGWLVMRKEMDELTINTIRRMQIKKKNHNDLHERKKQKRQLEYQTKSLANKCRQSGPCPRRHRKRERQMVKRLVQRSQRWLLIRLSSQNRLIV